MRGKISIVTNAPTAIKSCLGLVFINERMRKKIETINNKTNAIKYKSPSIISLYFYLAPQFPLL
jgi:hypothetical protein